MGTTDMIVRLVGVAEGWGKAAATAQQSVDGVERSAKKSAQQLESSQKRLEQAIVASEDRISKAREKAEDASRTVKTAEARLNEEREKYGAESSRALAAEEKLEKAKRQSAAAAGQLTREMNMAQDAQKALAKTTEDLEEANRQAATWQGKLQDKLDDFRGGGPEKELGLIAGAAIAAAGAVQLLSDGWSQAKDEFAANARLSASLGLDPAQAEAAGAAAGALYASGWGDSVEETSKATGSIMSSIEGMRDASEQELEAITAQGMALADVFDMDVSEAARNAGIWISEGLAKDATEAFDLMAAGLQQVPEALRGEVMDASHEYAQFFSQLGLDGSEAMALLVASSATGQYGIDKMGDSLKELTIRATDMSATSVDAFAAAGLNAEDMAARFLAGGEDARGALGDLVTGLQGIEDPAAQANAAIALFGTPLEDLGTDNIPAFLDQLGLMDGGMGDVSGTAQEITDQMAATVDPIEQVQRALVSTISDALEPFVEPAQALADWASENPELMQGIVIGLGVLAGALGVAAAAQWVMNSAMFASPITWIIVGIAALVAGFLWLWNNVDGFREFWTGAWDTIAGDAKQVGEWFTGTLVPWFQQAGETISNDFTQLSEWVGAKLDAIKDAGQTVADFFTIDIPNALENAKTWALDKINALKDGGISAFEALQRGVGEQMDKLKAAAAAPVNFVIDFVWNNGLRSMIHSIMDFFKLDESIQLPYIEPIALARGAIMGEPHGRPILWNEVPGVAEAYIPINGSARSMDLWAETGRQLGVIPMAAGGIWPANGTVTSPYGYRIGPFFGAEHHDGIDIGAPFGTPIYAALPGLVTFAGNNGGYGLQVSLDHGGGLTSFYAHLQGFSVAVGDLVDAGQVIAEMGSTGFSTGSHLHWGAALDGQSIDPSSLVNGDIGAAGAGVLGGILGIPGKIAGFIEKLGEIGTSPWAQMAGSAVKAGLGWIGDWVREKATSWLPDFGAPGGGNFDGWWADAISVAGPQWEQYREAVRTVAQFESGMDPNAVNDWDINAVNGTPSKGLLQFIEPTFRNYAWPGHNQWLSPVDQILAFFRYVPDRYGSIWNHPGLQGLAGGSGYVGYDAGGWLQPGITPTINLTGQPEAVLTADQWGHIGAMILTLQRLITPPPDAGSRTLTVRLADDQFDALNQPTIGEVTVNADSDTGRRLLTILEEAAK